MLEARLPHGKHLLVHDTDPEQRLAVAFQPGDDVSFQEDGEVVVFTLPPGHPFLDVFKKPPDGDIVLNLGT